MSPNRYLVSSSDEVNNGESENGAHKFECSRRCIREFNLKYKEKLIYKRDNSHLVLGEMMHACLAFWHASKMLATTQPSWYKNGSLIKKLEEISHNDTDLIKKCQDILNFYAIQDGSRDIGVPCHLEDEFRVPIHDIVKTFGVSCNQSLLSLYGNKKVTARFDMVVQKGTNYFIVEHKTSSPKTKNFSVIQDGEREWSLHWQMMLQTVLGKTIWGDLFGGVYLQRIKKHPPFAVDLSPIFFTQEQLSKIPWMLLKDMHNMQVSLSRNWEEEDPNYGACTNRRYDACEYLRICCAEGKSDLPNVINSLYTKDKNYKATIPKEDSTVTINDKVIVF